MNVNESAAASTKVVGAAAIISRALYRVLTSAVPELVTGLVEVAEGPPTTKNKGRSRWRPALIVFNQEACLLLDDFLVDVSGLDAGVQLVGEGLVGASKRGELVSKGCSCKEQTEVTPVK